jgi:hypothetical protein
MLRQDAEEVGADAAAAGWGGDRYAFFRRQGAPQECESECRADNALAIIWRGDDPSEAGELRAGIEDFVERSLEGESGTSTATWKLDGGWAAVGGTSDLVTLALAPTEQMAARLARPGK